MAERINHGGDSWLDGRKEDSFVIGKMSTREESMLVAKNITIWENYTDFWRPALDKGKKCWDYVVGDVLTEKEKNNLKAKDKLILQIPELVPKVNALVGMQIGLTRDGAVIAKSGDDAPDATVATEILKSVERANGIHQEYSDAFKDGIVTGFPEFVFFEREVDWAQNKRLEVFHDVWDAVYPDPNFKRLDLSDCENIIRIRTMSKDQMLERWPERKEAIDEGISKNVNSYENWNSSLYTSSDRNILFNALRASSEMYSRSGLNYVIERTFFVRKKTSVYVSPYSEQPEMLPPDWTSAEVEKWRSLHPDYSEVKMETDVLWVTVCTNSGVLLENGPHWFQESEWPCEMYVPQMMNNKPTGIVEFLLDNLKLGIFADIEHIHSIRLANDNLMIVKEGSLINAEDAASEKAMAGGILVRARSSEPADIEFPLNRREQTAYAELKNQSLETSNRIGVDRNFEGGIQTSQESGKSIEARIRQTQNKQAPYTNTFNEFVFRCRRKILQMMPYIWTEEHIFRYMDETTGQQKEIPVNVPMEFDWSGAVTKFFNNLNGAKYDYIPMMEDNSPSGKESELNVFMELLRNVLPTIPPDSWAIMLMTVPNRLANRFGMKMMEQQQAAQEAGPQPDPMKKTLSVSGDDLLYNPLVQQILQKEGILPEQLPEMPAGGAGMIPKQERQNYDPNLQESVVNLQ